MNVLNGAAEEYKQQSIVLLILIHITAANFFKSTLLIIPKRICDALLHLDSPLLIYLYSISLNFYSLGGKNTEFCCTCSMTIKNLFHSILLRVGNCSHTLLVK